MGLKFMVSVNVATVRQELVIVRASLVIKRARAT